MINFITRLFCFASLSFLSACGGGSDSDAAEAPAASYWTMDSYTYPNGGHSAVSTSSHGVRPLTVAVVSTATLKGGDRNNGAFSGSALTFSFAGTAAGVYQITTDSNALSDPDLTTTPIVVDVTVGAAVTTGATQYRASTGQVRVTIDTAGRYHFDTVGPLTAVKTMNLLGGVVNAPASMKLTIHDAN